MTRWTYLVSVHLSDARTPKAISLRCSSHYPAPCDQADRGPAAMALRPSSNSASPATRGRLPGHKPGGVRRAVLRRFSLPVFGFLRRASNGVVAPSIFHAGTDIPIYLAFLSYAA